MNAFTVIAPAAKLTTVVLADDLQDAKRQADELVTPYSPVHIFDARGYALAIRYVSPARWVDL